MLRWCGASDSKKLVTFSSVVHQRLLVLFSLVISLYAYIQNCEREARVGLVVLIEWRSIADDRDKKCTHLARRHRATSTTYRNCHLHFVFTMLSSRRKRMALKRPIPMKCNIVYTSGCSSRGRRAREIARLTGQSYSPNSYSYRAIVQCNATCVRVRFFNTTRTFTFVQIGT